MESTSGHYESNRVLMTKKIIVALLEITSLGGGGGDHYAHTDQPLELTNNYPLGHYLTSKDLALFFVCYCKAPHVT